MSNTSTSRLRGKVFDPRERRPDFKIEALTRMVRVNSQGDRIGDGYDNSRVTPFSLPRVRWLERGAP